MRLVLCSLILCSATMQAQSPAPPPITSQAQSQLQHRIVALDALSILLSTGRYGMNCPVGMKAERQASGQREWVVSLGDSLQTQRLNMRANKAGVRVELVGFMGKAMKQAEVEVFYMAPGAHVLPASQFSTTQPPYFDLTKTFVLSAADGESNSMAESLLVDNAASITRVRLLSIRYSDGSTWQAKSAGECSVEPGLFMAVAKR